MPASPPAKRQQTEDPSLPSQQKACRKTVANLSCLRLLWLRVLCVHPLDEFQPATTTAMIVVVNAEEEKSSSGVLGDKDEAYSRC